MTELITRLFLRQSSKERTAEFTVPLTQVGWGWGHGRIRWYRTKL